MAELLTRKVHKADCTADRPTAALSEFFDKYPDFCRVCRATGKVVRSGMELPCGFCMNGRWRCPRCLWLPENPDFWPGRCGFCGWSGAADGAPLSDCDCAPLSDCDCPEEITVENVRPLANKAQAVRDKRARLEALAGVTSAADAEPLDKNKPKNGRAQKNAAERRAQAGDELDGRNYDRVISEAE